MFLSLYHRFQKMGDFSVDFFLCFSWEHLHISSSQRAISCDISRCGRKTDDAGVFSAIFRRREEKP
jgi:hypothetical protein